MIAKHATAVTASDSTTFDSNTIGLYVGGAGNVTLTVNGSDVLFTAVPVGTIIPIRFSKVKSTGTTATAMVALYE
jgi:hypothetical protein